MKRHIGSKLGDKPKEENERILYPLTSSILSYDIRMTTIIILVLIIILYPHQYLLMKMKWMYLTLYSVNTWIGFIFFSFLEREEPEWCCLECQGRVCHKDIIALENGHLLPFKSHVYDWGVCVLVCVCARESEKLKKMPISGSLIPFLVLLKSVLIFHHWGFYGTDSIHEKSDGLNLIFQVQMFVMCKEKDRAL